MKHFYTYRIQFPLLLFMLCVMYRSGFGQCPGGYVPSGVAFDTTITFSSGSHASTIKFPKFDPTVGMVTCAKLTMTITSTLNFMRIENDDIAPNPDPVSITFIRKDTVNGPGLNIPLGNSETNTFGPYSLDPSDGVPSSGPDYMSVGPLNIFTTTKSVTITDLSDLSQFYGPVGDSLIYTYKAQGVTLPTIPFNYSGGINSSGSIHYRIEFCYCPATVLPLNIYSFDVKKITSDAAELKWNGTDDPGESYYYEAEVSRNAYNYTSIGILQKNDNNIGNYKMNFSALHGESGAYYFRVKQVYANGYVRYSVTRRLELESSDKIKFSVFPNPSNGIVGIKFDNISEEQFALQIYNTQGQSIVSKDLVVSGSSYVQVTTLKSGVYWMRLTNKKTLVSGVHQLLIK